MWEGKAITQTWILHIMKQNDSRIAGGITDGSEITILYGISYIHFYMMMSAENGWILNIWKTMYPDAAKQLLPYIEDECDRVAYEGSVMFDEYPDQLQLHLMGRRVYDRAKKIKWLKSWSEAKERVQMNPGYGIWYKWCFIRKSIMPSQWSAQI